jgi:two-component sensor histidine kinase
MHPDDLPRVQAAVSTALDGADIYEVTFRDRIVDPVTKVEGVRWLGARGRVTERDADGEPLQMIGVNWDATVQKEQEQRLSHLAAEMDHRVKNAFAVMRAMINIGRSSNNDKESFAETLKAQVDAMATAHALSAQMARSSQDANATVVLSSIFETALEPWMRISQSKVALSCDKGIRLTPMRVSAMSMLIYELVTNAVKYGALGDDNGSLAVEAHLSDDQILTVSWTEETPRFIVDQSKPFEGFGSMLINHCARTLGATLDRDVRDGRLKIVLTMPYSEDQV